MENVHAKNAIRSEDVDEGVNQILVVETSHQEPIYAGKASQSEWAANVDLPEEHPNQMKIIDHQNETLGNISLSHEQLMTILANKTEGGIVTLHLQNDDGVTAPVQLQIVPEDQVFQSFVPNEEIPGSMLDTVAPEATTLLVEGESKITPILQMSQLELQDLVNNDCKRAVKSIEFKRVKKAQETNNCITADPNLQKLIRRKTYLDLAKNEIMKEPVPSKKSSSQYKCNRCNRGFTTSGNLKRHILNIHSDHRCHNREQLACQFCGKHYSRTDYLAQHIKAVHDQVAKYKCEQCGKQFTQKGSQTRHVRAIHMNIRDFDCKYCEYRAMSYNDLKKHAAKAHFNRSRYECTICGHTSWTASVLKKHIINFHSENPKPQSRKCNYCGVMVNLSNESFPLHVAACKTVLPSGKKSGKRKRAKSATDESVDVDIESPSVSNVPAEYDMIPWEELCHAGEDDGSESSDEGLCEKVGSTVDNVIEGYIRDLQEQ